MLQQLSHLYRDTVARIATAATIIIITIIAIITIIIVVVIIWRWWRWWCYLPRLLAHCKIMHRLYNCFLFYWMKSPCLCAVVIMKHMPLVVRVCVYGLTSSLYLCSYRAYIKPEAIIEVSKLNVQIGLSAVLAVSIMHTMPYASIMLSGIPHANKLMIIL